MRSPAARPADPTVTAGAPCGSLDFGSASLTLTRNMPSLISFSLSLTSFTTSGGDELLVDSEARAAMRHEAERAVVVGLEACRPSTALMARSIVGSMCQSALASTVPGYCAAVSITLPITLTLALLRGVRDAEALGVHDVGAAIDHREGGFLGLRRVVPGVDEGHEELDVRIDRLRAVHEGVHQPVHLGDRVAADHADGVRLGAPFRPPCR